MIFLRLVFKEFPGNPAYNSAALLCWHKLIAVIEQVIGCELNRKVFVVKSLLYGGIEKEKAANKCVIFINKVIGTVGFHKAVFAAVVYSEGTC